MGHSTVWRCWKRGGYAQWDGDTSIFEGRTVRFGAYGEPVLMPYHMMKRIADAHGCAAKFPGSGGALLVEGGDDPWRATGNCRRCGAADALLATGTQQRNGIRKCSTATRACLKLR